MANIDKNVNPKHLAGPSQELLARRLAVQRGMAPPKSFNGAKHYPDGGLYVLSNGEIVDIKPVMTVFAEPFPAHHPRARLLQGRVMRMKARSMRGWTTKA